MKRPLILTGLSILMAGCLVPGAPHYYTLRTSDRQRSDSGYYISYQFKGQGYQFTFPHTDSVLVANAIDKRYRKMLVGSEKNDYYLNYRGETANERKKATANQTLFLKKYQGGQVTYDTMVMVPKQYYWQGRSK